MEKILLIDTSSNKQITVGLMVNSNQYWIKRKTEARKAQVALPLIDKLLKKHGLRANDIDCIKVKIESGSFTGIRVGMAIANAFSFALKIPVRFEK